MSKHCRILALILSLTTLFCALPALGDGLPEAFSVTYKTEDRFVNHTRLRLQGAYCRRQPGRSQRNQRAGGCV